MPHCKAKRGHNASLNSELAQFPSAVIYAKYNVGIQLETKSVFRFQNTNWFSINIFCDMIECKCDDLRAISFLLILFSFTTTVTVFWHLGDLKGLVTLNLMSNYVCLQFVCVQKGIL